METMLAETNQTRETVNASQLNLSVLLENVLVWRSYVTWERTARTEQTRQDAVSNRFKKVNYFPESDLLLYGLINIGQSCSEDTLSCAGGGCVPWSRTCDGHTNCEDGTDEPSICGNRICYMYFSLIRLWWLFLLHIKVASDLSFSLV